MLRLIHTANTMPVSYPVNPTAVFQPGMIAGLSVIGNDIVCGVSGGEAPFGIIDDVNSTAFTASAQDEIVIVPVVPAYDGYQLVAAADTVKDLANPSIIRSSFVSDTENITLNTNNGNITVAEGTPLNYDNDGDGTYDAVKVIVSYVYRINNIPGDNSTSGSGQISVWYQRGIFETDQYDTRQKYTVGCALFCGTDGKLTSAQPSASHPGIAMCLGPPSSITPTIEFLFF